MPGIIQRNKALIFLFGILAIAAFFRLWQLDSIPPGLYPDVAMNGNDALETLRTGNLHVFYPENNGREGLMMWLTALSFSIFGVSIWSIKIVSAIVGILTVLGLYLLTKELFLKSAEVGPRQIALLASFFLAVSFWHVNFSRIGFRAILLPFILVFCFYFLFRGLQTQKIWHFILAGVFFGLGFYTYTSFRMAVLILPFVLIPYWLIYKNQGYQKKYLFFIFYFLFFIFIVALPLGIYFLHYSQDFISRATPISIFAAENPIKELGKSLILHLGMFNFYGDPNWRHNFAGSPVLFWPVGILFLIGFSLSCKNCINSLKNKNWKLDIGYWILISWFFIMLLPGILTFEGIPHSLRVIGVLPPVFIFVGLGAWKTFEFFNNWGKRKKLLVLASFFLLFAVGFAEFNKYFTSWAKEPKVAEAFTKNYYDIGNFLNNLPAETKKYVIVNEPGSPLYGISIPGQTPIFIESARYGKPRAVYLKFEDLGQIKIDSQKTIIIPLYNGRTFDAISKRFPQGEIQIEDGIWTYKTNF